MSATLDNELAKVLAASLSNGRWHINKIEDWRAGRSSLDYVSNFYTLLSFQFLVGTDKYN